MDTRHGNGNGDEAVPGLLEWPAQQPNRRHDLRGHAPRWMRNANDARRLGIVFTTIGLGTALLAAVKIRAGQMSWAEIAFSSVLSFLILYAGIGRLRLAGKMRNPA